MKVLLGMAVVLLAACGGDSMTEAERLDTEAVKVRGWTSEAFMVGAVRAQNQQSLSAATISQRDAAWIARTAAALEAAVLTGACADGLRLLASQRAYYAEVLLMDNQGALVCATHRTTDYWQGDEDKWQRAWAGGAGATFIAEAAFDESRNERLVHISVPVRDGTTLVGALAVGIAVDRF